MSIYQPDIGQQIEGMQLSDGLLLSQLAGMKVTPQGPSAGIDGPVSVSRLDENEILALFAGRDAWHLEGVPRLGIPPIQVADCGHGVTLVIPPYGSATCFPTSVGMAASWNPDLLVEVGRALGRESRAKGCGMLLAPMVNLHRLPCGGRNYESFSEDPLLTARLAAAIVNGLQDEGTGACVKVFLCNNQQRDQMNTSVEVDPQTLEDLYLRLFRLIFQHCDPWAVMTSYNPVNGEYPSDSAQWIKKILRKQLAYKGVVMSDWNAIHSIKALTSGLDIEMPGPARFLTPENFRQKLQSGELDWPELQERAQRILDLHEKVRPAWDGSGSVSPPELDSPRHRELACRVAEESLVLLKNEGPLLPLDENHIQRIAVIGPNADAARLGGGGSASVSAFNPVTVLDGITALVPERVEVVHAEGCPLGDGMTAVPAEALAPTGSEAFGSGLTGFYYTTEAFDCGHEPVMTKTDRTIDFSWGWAAPAEGLPRIAFAMQWNGSIRFPVGGRVRMSLSTTESIARVWIDGKLVLDCWSAYDKGNFEDQYTNRTDRVDLEVQKNERRKILVEYRKTGTRAGLKLGWQLPGEADPLQTAARLARSADAVILVGGLSNMFEGGMHDREAFELPGRQKELIEAVAAANPCTVVVLINGTPVSMSGWSEQVPAIIEAFYLGQEGGTALARILFGRVNPSGRLPDTIPQSWSQVKAMEFYPGKEGKVRYGEGLMVGYRHFDTAGIEPAWPFGYGLSYTEFHYKPPRISSDSIGPEETLTVEVEVANTGGINGKETVQLYLEPEEPRPGQPARELAGFAKLSLQPGECGTTRFSLRYADFLGFDPDGLKPMPRARTFRIRVGPHSREGDFVRVAVKMP